MAQAGLCTVGASSVLGLHPPDAISIPTLAAVTTINVSRGQIQGLEGEREGGGGLSLLKTTGSEKYFL